MAHALSSTACIAGLALSVACSKSRSPTPEPNVITVVASDYAFHAPAEVPAGFTKVVMVNTGAETHWMEMYKLADGKQLSDFRRVLEETHLAGTLPRWLTAAGGPGWISPGDTSNATSYLATGEYVLLCRFPTTDGVSHYRKGMVTTLRLIATGQRPATEPGEDIVLTISDSAFHLSSSLRSGRQTVRVENAGTYRHEVYVFQLAPRKAIEDYWAWERAGLKEIGPGRPLGGVTPFEPGQRLWFTAVFEPGEYVLGDESGEGSEIFLQVTAR